MSKNTSSVKTANSLPKYIPAAVVSAFRSVCSWFKSIKNSPIVSKPKNSQRPANPSRLFYRVETVVVCTDRDDNSTLLERKAEAEEARQASHAEEVRRNLQLRQVQFARRRAAKEAQAKQDQDEADRLRAEALAQVQVNKARKEAARKARKARKNAARRARKALEEDRERERQLQQVEEARRVKAQEKELERKKLDLYLAEQHAAEQQRIAARVAEMKAAEQSRYSIVINTVDHNVSHLSRVPNIPRTPRPVPTSHALRPPMPHLRNHHNRPHISITINAPREPITPASPMTPPADSANQATFNQGYTLIRTEPAMSRRRKTYSHIYPFSDHHLSEFEQYERDAAYSAQARSGYALNYYRASRAELYNLPYRLPHRHGSARYQNLRVSIEDDCQ